MKPLKLLLAGGLLAAGLAGAVLGLRYAYQRVAAAYWQVQLGTIPEDRARGVLDRVASLGEPGTAVLVEALGSGREGVAEASLVVLLERLAAWQESPTAAHCRRQARLARALAEHAPGFEREGQERAARLAARILLWLPPEREVDRAAVIADCGRVLEAARAGRAVPAPEPFSRELAASLSSRTPAVLPPLEDEHGGMSEGWLVELGRRDPDRWTPEPLVPVRVPHEPRIAAGAGGESSMVPRPLPPPPSTAPGDPAPDEPSNTHPEDDAPEKADLALPGAVEAASPGFETLVLPDAPGGPVGEPSEAKASSPPLPDEVHDDAHSLPAEDLSTADTVELMRRLQDPRAADTVRAELVRRGFTPVHLELAERLFCPDAATRAELVRLLLRLGSVDPDPWLWQLAEDPEARVRAEAISALATAADPTLLERLERLVREDPDPEIRSRAAQIARIRENRLR